MLKGKTVVLGVTGSIAAYKIANLASMLVKQHADVNVIMTHNATNFINPITFETLTGNKCLVDTFDRNFEFNVEHVALAKRADIFMVAPASANVIGKMANGIADDMLTTTILAAKCPKLVSPAMNTNMYENRIVQDNIKKLEQYGFEMIKPAEGYLACGDTGAGKMPEPQTLFNYIMRTNIVINNKLGKFISLSEYSFQIPANRIGFIGNGGPFSLMQLKVIQEVVTLIIFTIFTTVLFKGESLHWNHFAAFVCLVLAVYFVFYK